MKVFVSCPMNGRDDHDIFTEQMEAVEFIRTLFPEDHVELMDNRHNRPSEDEAIKRPRVDVLGQSIQMMAQADLVVFSGEWWADPGCSVERKVATEYNMPTCLLTVEKPRVQMQSPEVAKQYKNQKN